MFFLLCSMFALMTLENVHGSHFRGGVFMVRPVGQFHYGDEMEISFYISFRRSRSGCTNSSIETNQLLQGEGSLICQDGCSGTIISDFSYKCVQFSEAEDWTLGENTIFYNFSSVYLSSDTITIGYMGTSSSCCWISGVGRSSWNLFTTFSLALREDTGEINSTPRVATFPVIRLLSGCTHTIPLPVTDPDNDVIKCQWADEIIPTGAVLNSDTCTITYDTSHGTGYEAIALVIEDFATENSTEPLSQVSLQFVVIIYSDNSESCPDPQESVQSQPSPSNSISPSISSRSDIGISSRIIFAPDISISSSISSDMLRISSSDLDMLGGISSTVSSDMLGISSSDLNMPLGISSSMSPSISPKMIPSFSPSPSPSPNISPDISTSKIIGISMSPSMSPRAIPSFSPSPSPSPNISPDISKSKIIGISMSPNMSPSMSPRMSPSFSPSSSISSSPNISPDISSSIIIVISISPTFNPTSPSPTHSFNMSPSISRPTRSPSPAQPQCDDSSLQCKQWRVKQICEAMKIRGDKDLPPRCSST